MSIDYKIDLKQIGVPEEKIETLWEKMEQYINELILYNSAYNLTNTSDHDELAVRHIYDSLAAYPQIEKLIEEQKQKGVEVVTLADIGSGGGLPGIPLAAAFPEYNFKLVERMTKRCSFLENCAAILGLKNVEVINSEAERAPQEAFDIVVFRAFRPLDDKMTKTLLRLTKTGGVLAAYKAKVENIKEEMNGISKLVPEYDVLPLKVPFLEDSERNLVVIKK